MTHPNLASVSRRMMLKTGVGAAAGLVIGFRFPALAEEVAPPAPGTPAPPLPDPNAFLRIGTDGAITILLSHSEMGQGIWTTLPMLLAEELGCDWSRIRVEHAPAAPPYFHTAFGMQMTGGSTTTWSEFDRYRQVGALARAMLVRAAAASLDVDASACRVESGEVIAGAKRVSFGELAAAAQALTPPAEVALKPAGEWTRIGHATKRLDSPEKVTGRAVYGMDVRFPGLMTALVARPPVFGARVTSFDDAAARKVPGVKAVVHIPSGVGVVADHFWAAKMGRDALRVEWDLGAGAKLDTAALLDDFRSRAKEPGLTASTFGDVTAAMAKATQKIEVEYDGPYLSHSPMEPLNATAKVTADGCELWVGTQFQTVDQGAAAAAAGVKPEQVTIHTTFLGGGFGRRANPASDFVLDAVHLAKATGMAVKAIWTREDDTRGGYYRPMWLHRATAGLDGAGNVVAWDHRVVCQSIVAGTPFAPMLAPGGVDHTSVEGVFDSPYLPELPHRVGLHSPELPVPVLWWRSVGHSHSGFAMESLVDELAHAAKADPVEFRRRLLAKQPRPLGVLNLAAEKAGWGKPLPAGRARGIAVHASFGSFVAQVAEVSVEDDEIRVHRVVSAVDCGVCVNPAGVAAQMEGGVVFGLSAALESELTLSGGRVEQSNFHDYRLLRMYQAPEVETHVVPSAEKPGGAGEPGVPPIAPAVANAVFALTGRRLRRLPLRLA